MSISLSSFNLWSIMGTINEWMDDTYNKPVKVLVEKVDEDCFHTEIWDLQIGRNGKPVIKMKYTRKK